MLTACLFNDLFYDEYNFERERLYFIKTTVNIYRI